jgi:hypothetical protein
MVDKPWEKPSLVDSSINVFADDHGLPGITILS